jgi:hypothetical protein
MMIGLIETCSVCTIIINIGRVRLNTQCYLCKCINLLCTHSIRICVEKGTPIRRKATCTNGCRNTDDAPRSLRLRVQGRPRQPRPAVKELTTKSGEERRTRPSPQLTRLQTLQDDGGARVGLCKSCRVFTKRLAAISHFYGTRGFVHVTADHCTLVWHIRSLHILRTLLSYLSQYAELHITCVLHVYTIFPWVQILYPELCFTLTFKIILPSQ